MLAAPYGRAAAAGVACPPTHEGPTFRAAALFQGEPPRRHQVFFTPHSSVAQQVGDQKIPNLSLGCVYDGSPDVQVFIALPDFVRACDFAQEGYPAAGRPTPNKWRQGPKVAGNSMLEEGSAIATFDASGHFAGHTGIYLGQDTEGIFICDQWGGHADPHLPNTRRIYFGRPWNTQVNQGEAYHVVTE